MPSNYHVAIVGRPNVGKSRLFNRLAGKRISIVHDMPGVTRDLVAKDLEDGYTLMDTGGMGLPPGTSETPARIVDAVEGQIAFAIDAANLILFTIDGREPLSSLDFEMAERLRKSKKDVMLVINKVDTDRTEVEISEYYKLGLGEPSLVSAEHDRGIDGLKRRILDRRDEKVGAPLAKEELAAKRIRICFIGRPNVGKSSLSNCLLQSNRFIVSDVPGTTRDSVETDFDWKSKRGENWHFTLTDTAGIRKKTNLNSSVEYFSRVRSLDAIQEMDVVVMVIDAADGVTNLDKAIAGEATAANKPVLLVVNKWDLVLKAWEAGEIHGFESEKAFREDFEKGLTRALFFAASSPVRFVSAKEGIDIDKMLFDVRQLDKRMDQVLATGQLNRIVYGLAERMPAPKIKGRRFRVYYAVQTGGRPYRIRLFCNQERHLPDNYKRYLSSGLVEEFKLDGCPIVFELVNKKNPYVKEGPHVPITRVAPQTKAHRKGKVKERYLKKKPRKPNAPRKGL